MRIALVSMDTRGGIQPYVALAAGLRRAGHDAWLVAPSDGAAMAAAAGVPVAPLTGSVEAVLRGSGGAAERGTLSAMRFAGAMIRERVLAWAGEALAACAGAELVTGGVGGMVVALSVAERLGVPFVESHLQPIGAPTSRYPGALFGSTPSWLGPLGRRASHALTEAGVWMPFRGAMRAAREEVLGLRGRPRAADGQPVLYGFSPRVVPVPAGRGRAREVTGYWTEPTPDAWAPPPALEAFLARGGPVVSIGFGSMASGDPAALTALVRGAARDAGVRAVLLAGWGGLAAEGDDGEVLGVEALPHEWLFPRVAAAVHHGGAGTTGAALRAGVPAVVVPFAMDQPFWAGRVAALGVGPAPIARARLTRAALGDALRQAVGNEAMRARAATLGAALRTEDGVGRAVACFEAAHVAR
ncbi:MAG: glycosyltransferase [Deltaproteobacteria bacterium]|nr:glycosyltransferase [Myxococcales bacterium]MDP3220221.1 glycosyltransferase [Deltaproteobacteria bacterium]